ncbi:MAG TPA: hypothetical protein VD994_10465, partial [Prosthecobacter sp.]|nr:hypothetical protein [Prosthecobacter sp.]
SGVPMLAVQLPMMVMALPVVIAVEAALCRRWLGVTWRQAWAGAAAANGVSTLAGFPLAWGAMVALQLAADGGAFSTWPEPWFSVYSVTVQAAWLLPHEGKLYWMIPAALLVLLIPSFFVTVWMEIVMYGRMFKEVVGVGRATWRMHFVTYGLLLAGGLWLLWTSIRQHETRVRDYDGGMEVLPG